MCSFLSKRTRSIYNFRLQWRSQLHRGWRRATRDCTWSQLFFLVWLIASRIRAADGLLRWQWAHVHITQTPLCLLFFLPHEMLRLVHCFVYIWEKQILGDFLLLNTNHSHNTTNAHNKAFILNFFLNETCKNAMNITDFADSINLN